MAHRSFNLVSAADLVNTTTHTHSQIWWWNPLLLASDRNPQKLFWDVWSVFHSLSLQRTLRDFSARKALWCLLQPHCLHFPMETRSHCYLLNRLRCEGVHLVYFLPWGRMLKASSKLSTKGWRFIMPRLQMPFKFLWPFCLCDASYHLLHCELEANCFILSTLYPNKKMCYLLLKEKLDLKGNSSMLITGSCLIACATDNGAM